MASCPIVFYKDMARGQPGFLLAPDYTGDPYTDGINTYISAWHHLGHLKAMHFGDPDTAKLILQQKYPSEAIKLMPRVGCADLSFLSCVVCDSILMQ